MIFLMRMMNIPTNFKWSDTPESILNNMTLAEKEEYLKKNEINIRQSIGEAVPTIIMEKIARNIKEASYEIKRTEFKEINREISITA